MARLRSKGYRVQSSPPRDTVNRALNHAFLRFIPPMISDVPSSVALREPWIMPAKVIMLMHANGERDSNDGEPGKVVLVIHASTVRKDKSIRGRFVYIYIYIFPYSSLLSSSFFLFIHSFSSSISRFRSNSSTDRGNFQPVTAHSNKLFFIMWWIDQAVDKEKSSLLLHFGSLCHRPFSPSSHRRPFFNAFSNALFALLFNSPFVASPNFGEGFFIMSSVIRSRIFYNRPFLHW